MQETIMTQDAEEVASLLGVNDENLRVLEEVLGTRIRARGNEIEVLGDDRQVARTSNLISELLGAIREGHGTTSADVRYAAERVQAGQEIDLKGLLGEAVLITERGRAIRPRTMGQRDYVGAIAHRDITFGIGPAGTGKTYLAVAAAVASLRAKKFDRIILTRPAVEAGESLGFLPGDLREKVDPYLRPLYDALYDMVAVERAQRMMERQVIEVVPLAYMRGRTLNDAFIILDEAQNTTIRQMQMFLTRMGLTSKVVVTGDVTQVDLPPGRESGLNHATSILQGIPGIEVVYLGEEDVVRHSLVRQIIRAYGNHPSNGVGLPGVKRRGLPPCPPPDFAA